METSATLVLDGDVPVTTSSNRLRAIVLKLFKLWASLQVSYYGGKYSIERALALNEYTRTTSLLRVIMVCLVTPLPMITLVFLQELLPLQDPADGWRANYGFWIRLVMLSAVTANTFLVQGTFMVADFTLSWRQIVLFITGLSLTHTVASMAVSATLFFPIPFFYVTMTPSFYIPLFTVLYFMMGKNNTNCMCYIATQKIMGMVYPAYQLLFHKAVSTRYVLPVVLLQPVIKIVAKNIVLHFTKQLEDLTPEAVIFTVDFYNSLYLSTFMENASTVTTMMILIGTDVTQTLLVLLKMQRRTGTILQRLHHTANAFANEDLLSALCLLCRNQDQLAAQTHEGVRVRSCLAHQLSPTDNNLLFMLEKSTVNAPHATDCWPTVAGPNLSRASTPLKPTSPIKRIQQVLGIRCSNAVAPTTTNATNSRRRSVRLSTSEMKTFREGPRVLSANRAQHSDILRETLTTLYTMECLVLTAYLETLIPVLYGNYLIVMVYFPNAAYHTELKNITRQNVDNGVTVVFLFGLLQFMSFGLLAGLIHRKCGMNVLYQLAFVLETQMSLVQGKLMIWMLVTLACRVTHFGVDYSFEFSWIK